MLYHFNHHYQLLEAITHTDITGLVIDTSVIPDHYQHYIDPIPSIRYLSEAQGIDINGWELRGYNKNSTWVGIPNASWIQATLQHLGWRIRSHQMVSMLRTIRPNLRHRGVITAVRIDK